MADGGVTAVGNESAPKYCEVHRIQSTGDSRIFGYCTHPRNSGCATLTFLPRAETVSTLLYLQLY